jgi:hypothetical protein
MEKWNEIRRKVLVEGISKRAICRDYGVGWWTLEKMLALPEPPGYREVTTEVLPLGKYNNRPGDGAECAEVGKVSRGHGTGREQRQPRTSAPNGDALRWGVEGPGATAPRGMGQP